MSTPLINATLDYLDKEAIREGKSQTNVEQLDEKLDDSTHLVRVKWTHRKYQRDPATVSYRVKANSDDEAAQKVIKHLRKAERVVHKVKVEKYTGQPSAFNAVNEEAKKSPWTVGRHGGDDEYSYALFKDGKPAMTGLGKREAKYHLERAKAGHYDRKLDEDVEQINEINGSKKTDCVECGVEHGTPKQRKSDPDFYSTVKVRSDGKPRCVNCEKERRAERY